MKGSSLSNPLSLKEGLIMKTTSLTVAFSGSVFQQIRDITYQQKISMAEWARVACERALTELNISK
jgi:hypothetical protein